MIHESVIQSYNGLNTLITKRINVLSCKYNELFARFTVGGGGISLIRSVMDYGSLMYKDAAKTQIHRP